MFLFHDGFLYTFPEQYMKKFFCAIFLFSTLACENVITQVESPADIQELLVIIESNTPWTGKIDTFTVSGDSIHWFRVRKSGTTPICWNIQKTQMLGMIRAYASTTNFQYGWRLEDARYPMWSDSSTTIPYGTIRGCTP